MTTHLRRRAVLDSEVKVESTATATASKSTSTSTSSSNYSDDVKRIGEEDNDHRLSLDSDLPSSPIAMTTYSYNGNGNGNGNNFNKNPLKLGKDGEERLAEIFRAAADGGNGIGIGSGDGGGAAIDAIDATTAEGGGVTNNDSTTITTGSSLTQHYENPSEVNALWYTAGVSYFPDQVARVSYIASIVNPDSDGDYLKDLQGGMALLATRLAPAYFPGTIVRDITTQVDGYFPAACPSDKFQNCQDVTASIGIYLNVLPLSTVSTGSSDNSIISNNNSNNDDDSDDNKNNKTTTNNNAVVDPSTMTEELIAFQNSFEAAIANNELQDAIREDYRQKNNDELSSAGPPVMIVTVNGLETIPPVDAVVDNENENNEGNGGNINNNSDNGTETDTVVDNDNEGDDEADIGTEINTDNDNDVSSVSTGGLITDTGLPDTAKPFDPTSSIAAEATGEDTINRDISMSTGGIVGTAIVSLLLVSAVAILAVVRRRTRNDRHGGWHGKKKKTKSNDKRRVNGDDDDCRDGSGYDLSEQNLLRNAYDSDDDYNNDGDLEDITGRTMRTAVSGSTAATATSHDLRALTMEGDEILVPVVATSSSSLSIGTETSTDGGCATSSPSRSIRHSGLNMQPILEYNYEEEGKVVDNLVSQAVVVSDDLISFDEAPNDAKKEVNEKGNDEDESNDYVVGEDDDSHSSVGEQLLSASRSSELCIAASTSSELHNPDPSATTAVIEAAAVAITTTGIAAATDSIASPETRKETIDPSNNTLLRVGDFSSPRKLSHSTSFPSSSSMSSDGGSTVGMESIRPLSELDTAIANGDWAAVGATAALMATSIHDAPSPKSRRNRQPSSASSVTSSDFSQKATELDRLIDAGDWQAVVVAAARYDAEGGSTIGGEDASRSCRSRTSTQEGSDANDTSSYASNTDYSMSMGRSVATSASQKERVQEIREQVTKLVLDTVPDEADNVDEMMNQFKGKEEELLETLRTMKERNVAKKARVESQKIARRNTRSRDKKEGFPSTAATATSTPSTTPDVGRLVNDGSGTEEHSEDILASNNSNDNDSMPQGSSSVTTDNDEETVETGYDSGKEYVGSFENATRVDPDTAAAAAAAWAIQRSLDNMMEKEEKGLK